MTGRIYDHLLIIGTFCSFIRGMTNGRLLHYLFIPTLLEMLQKSSQKNYASVGILGKELLASGPGFTRPGTPNSASPSLTKHDLSVYRTACLTAPCPSYKRKTNKLCHKTNFVIKLESV